MLSADSITLRTLAIDSRARASGTSEDFTLELQESVEKPRGAVCWMTNASLPTVWRNIEANNNRLYLKEVRLKNPWLRSSKWSQGSTISPTSGLLCR